MFSNQQLDVSSLPKLESIEFTPIPRKYLIILVTNRLLLFAMFVALLIGSKYAIEEDGYQSNFAIVTSIIALLWLVNLIIALAGFKKRGFVLREKDIVYTHGLITNHLVVIPFSRIQHVEQKRSFLARKLGLSNLKIFTAGESGSDLKINGLTELQAQKIKTFLSDKVDENS